MRTIEIDCPGCQTKLELDSGFAGGVCRCSNCGTLMTVPADPAHERAERLTRPDRPDAPGRPGAAREKVAAGSRRPEAPGQAPTAADEEMVEATLDDDSPPASGGGGDTEIFTTASGKQVRVPRRLIVTAKAKRKVIRGGVIAVFIGMVVLMTAAVVVAVKVLLYPAPVGPTPMETQIATDGYDPSVNPFTLARANFLGIPLSPTAVVAIDASAASSGWLSTVKKSVLVGTRSLPASARFQVIFWIEGGVSAYADNPKPIGKSDRAALASFLDSVTAGGEATPSAAVRKAISSNVDQVILVTGQPLDAAVLTGVVEALQSRPNLRFDAVVIGGDESPDLRKLVKEHQGVYMSVSTHQLSDWYQAADDEGVFSKPE